MPGIAIPRDRTTKQKPRGFCYNPACLETSDQQRFEFDIEHDHMACPKCGACDPPMVGLLGLTHFLVRNSKGLLRGYGGLRYNVACDPKRAYLATMTNEEHMTGDSGFVNCLGCVAEIEKQKMAPQQGSPLVLKKGVF